MISVLNQKCRNAAEPMESGFPTLAKSGSVFIEGLEDFRFAQFLSGNIVRFHIY